MIRIVVVTHQGAPVARSLAVQFGPGGGTIGRAPTNALVLDDPERTVSRVHAQVVCREGHYFVVDRGSNPMLCNGRPLGAGNEVALHSGDRLVLGGFELRVEAEPEAPIAPAAGGPGFGDELGLGFGAAVAAPATDDDPFADLLAGLGPAPAAPSPAPAAARRPADPMLFPNPLESGAGRSAQSAADDPFADLLGPGPAAAPRGPAALDDFSDLGIPSAGKATSIDDLFGGSAGMGGLGGDPLALSPLADPLLQPNTAAHADPLAALQGTPRPSAAPRSDHLPVGQFGYVPPLAVTPSAPAPAAVAFDDETGLPIAKASPRVPAPVPAPAPAVMPPPAQRPVAPATPASDAELLAAFLRGLGSQHQPPDALTPGLMERIGVILRSSTEGTLQLLLTRQEFKREVRAEVTMIASQANNPLKFSPTVEVALAHLLGPGVRGFMPPEAAMRDAYNDLRAHQFGVMVGMRAALAHVIERFAPDELEKKIAAKSALDSLFAANRKARLWDQFVALYGGIATEAEDDFHSLFGKAFLEAYEAQMERLKSGQ
ncbi:type VI secretion system-associated FHA domain protein TagH [Variovorax sp. J22G21]|uniref:type VI secretion system-associated FHA domain protein TagH n=1 Tax=Variovorax fucosicus TaxID=3053517 RepID=UPI002577D9A1|nr:MULTISPECIES: type VI secretion system-associated FHA domain protein TagH [unclassified Variovorax]MDM0039722.1 type VI secretion system-associated FHA domain protein TagH [Variovorax sp. J22R193]MDM0064497.1 type VI secretion system-associated FHA domain protein TagH [Variovorax sp. J22G21]